MRWRSVVAAAVCASVCTAASIPASSPLVTWQGRTIVGEDGRVSFDFAGVTATVRVTGATSVWAVFNSTFLSSAPAPGGQRVHGAQLYGRQLQDSSYPKFGVYRPAVNGQRTGLNITILPGQWNMTVASGLDPTATLGVDIRYTTDPVYNTWPDVYCPGCVQSILSIGTDGSFVTPPPPLARNILVVGDSITAGNAVWKPCVNASESDISAAYGSQLCERFMANCTTIAISSKGLYHNCCDDLPATVPMFAMRTLAQDPNTTWDWNGFIPDAVIINLGTNDAGHDSGPAWEAAFVATYVAFLRNITQLVNKPSLPFFLGVGPITVRYEPWVLSTMAVAKAQYGISTTLLNFTGAELDGCGHPGPIGHSQMFAMAEPVISAVMGWS